MTDMIDRLRLANSDEGVITESWRRRLLIGFFVGILVFPLLVRDPFITQLLLETFIFAIVVISYDLLFGFSGLLSFGHALFFGGGAYAVIILGQVTGLGFLTAIPITLALVAVVVAVIGVISLRLVGVYFAIITLAFAQLAYEATLQFRNVTGGRNGLSGFTIPSVGGVSLGETLVTYYLLAVALILVYLLVRRIVRSPFGRVLQGIRENEERTRMLGINTFRYKIAAFVLSGVIAAFAGILYPLYLPYVSPSLLHWSTTGDVLIMTLIGGIGTLWGPIIGSGFFIFIKQVFKSQFGQWRIFFGLLFVLLVLFSPSGLAGIVKERLRGPSLVSELKGMEFRDLSVNRVVKILRGENK